MFKFIVNWLTQVRPLENWVILIVLLCLVLSAAFVLKYSIRKKDM